MEKKQYFGTPLPFVCSQTPGGFPPKVRSRRAGYMRRV